MYCKMVLKSGATLSQLKTDLVGLLTNTITDKANLLSADAASSELVITEAAEWTFVQDLADTATRKHFVLSGVDNGGIKKTLGIILTDTSGTLGFRAWVAPEWDAAAKRPKAIDLTGWAISQYSSAAYFAAGGDLNGIYLVGLSSVDSSVQSVGQIGNASVHLQVASVQGNTAIVAHTGVTHTDLLRYYDIDRSVIPDMHDPAAWPFMLVAAFNSASLSTALPGIPGVNYGATGPGICGGTGNGNGGAQPLQAPLSTELGAMKACAQLYSYSSFSLRHRFGLANGGSLCRRPADRRNTASELFWMPGYVGLYDYGEAFNLAPFKPLYPIRKAAPGSMQQTLSGYNSSSVLPYLDEIVAAGETYVATGGGSYSLSLYKG